MKITSATFSRGVTGNLADLELCSPQFAFIGRSNAGKSSIINTITKVKDLARTSSFPGRTQEINLFLINKSFYLADLPGYGFAKASKEGRERLKKLISWYLRDSQYQQEKIILIIDANIGFTDNDLEMLEIMEDQKKNIVIVANKIDKIKPSQKFTKLKKIQEIAKNHTVIPFSSKERIGIAQLTDQLVVS